MVEYYVSGSEITRLLARGGALSLISLALWMVRLESCVCHSIGGTFSERLCT